MICPICGKSRNAIAGVFAGPRHPECVKAEAQRLRSEAVAREKAETDRRREQHEKLVAQIAMGVFKSLNHEAEIMLDEGETCCAIVKGCWSTLFYPRAAGRALPGQAVRVDGLKKSDWGTLHVTNKRVCFVGRGGAKALPIKKLIQCETHNDVLHVTAEGRASSSYFIIESQEALEMLATSIRKLAALAKAGEKPTIE
jgi:hypothetical protein